MEGRRIAEAFKRSHSDSFPQKDILDKKIAKKKKRDFRDSLLFSNKIKG